MTVSALPTRLLLGTSLAASRRSSERLLDSRRGLFFLAWSLENSVAWRCLVVSFGSELGVQIPSLRITGRVHDVPSPLTGHFDFLLSFRCRIFLCSFARRRWFRLGRRIRILESFKDASLFPRTAVCKKPAHPLRNPLKLKLMFGLFKRTLRLQDKIHEKLQKQK